MNQPKTQQTKPSAGALRAAELLTPHGHPGAFASCGNCHHLYHEHNEFDGIGCDKFVDSEPKRERQMGEARHNQVVSAAQTIDRETGVAELLEAAIQALDTLDHIAHKLGSLTQGTSMDTCHARRLLDQAILNIGGVPRNYPITHQASHRQVRA